MSSMDTDTTREGKIETLLLIIAGAEVSLRQFPDDARFRSTVKKMQRAKLEELRKVIYGYNEDSVA